MKSLVRCGAAILVSIALLGSGSAQAATMTFSGIGGGYDASYGTTYVEDGIVATSIGHDFGSFEVPGTAHLDDSGSPFSRAITFRMGKRFSAVGFDLLPYGFDYFTCLMGLEGDDCTVTSYPNVRVAGFRDGVQVAEAIFDMGEADRRYAFDPSFRKLDSLLIGFGPFPYLPEFASYPYYTCDAPCSHYNIDNVTLAPVPVPLPAAAGSLVAALVLLSALRRRQRGASIR